MDITSSLSETSKKIVLNVCGEKYELCSWTVLNRLPNTRLGKLCAWSKGDTLPSDICDDFCAEENEYFFNRNFKNFGAILSLYHTGKLHCPDGVCVVAFMEDLNYWGIDACYLDDCCRHRYFQLMEQVKDEIKEIDELNSPVEDENFGRICAGWRKYVWNVFERPMSSWIAKTMAVISITVIIASTIVLALNTMTEFRIMECIYENTTLCDEPSSKAEETLKNSWVAVDNYYFVLAEEICITWFTIEYLTRLLVCPNKCRFLKDLFNIFDLLAILPYYLIFAFFALEHGNRNNYHDIRRLIQVFRLMRIIRVFKLARHSTGLQSLLFTLKKSYRELGILFLLLVLGVILFSSLAYYAEKHHNLDFDSIPAAFWWAAVTMNVVGLGNMQPITTTGKIISFICGVCGMLFIGLPIPIIVDNFATYYSQHKRRLKVVKKYRAWQRGEELPVVATNSFRCMTEGHLRFVKFVANRVHQEQDNSPIEANFTKRPRVNVGGKTFEFTWNLLDNLPICRLSQLRQCTTRAALLQICDEYMPFENEYFFHRDPKPFVSILNFYCTGKLHLLEELCPTTFEEELKYWMVDENNLQSCCQYQFSRKKELVAQEIKEIQELLHQTHEENFGNGMWANCRKYMWNVMETPSSSWIAKIFAIISIVITMVSAIVLTLKTMPAPNLAEIHTECTPHGNNFLFYPSCRDILIESLVLRKIELFCVSWFGLEYFLRLILSPNKVLFLRSKLNNLDPAIVACYIISQCLFQYSSKAARLLGHSCDILRILRLLRIFKLGKNSTALEALGYTLKNSIKHLGVLLIFLAVGVLVFSSVAYVAEKDENVQFMSIPRTFWWALVTMHTLSIGDMYTMTTMGKIISFVCGLFGLLFLVLPIPIIASNFKEFYQKKMRLDRARQKCILMRRVDEHENAVDSENTPVE